MKNAFHLNFRSCSYVQSKDVMNASDECVHCFGAFNENYRSKRLYPFLELKKLFYINFK
jgi:hypothetical protein